MRANSSISSLIVVTLAATSGCRPADEPVAVAPPVPEPAPAPSPGPSQSALDELLDQVENVRAAPAQAVINTVRERPVDTRAQGGSGQTAGSTMPARVIDRLISQCSDDVTFAVRIYAGKLWVFPPGYSNGYIILDPVASDDGVHYAQRDADFRAKDDLATLRVDNRRYVDCVSNPAAAVWQQLTP